MEAAYKASILLAQNDFVGGVVIFQNGQDPADYVKEGRVDELKSLLLHPKYFVEFTLDYIVKDNLGNYRFDINRPEEKQKILVKIEEFLSTLKPAMAEEFKGYAAHLINLHPKYIKTTLGVSSKAQKPGAPLSAIIHDNVLASSDAIKSDVNVKNLILFLNNFIGSELLK